MHESTILKQSKKTSLLALRCILIMVVCGIYSTTTRAEEGTDIETRISEIRQQIEVMQSDNERLRTEISDREEQIRELRQQIEKLDKQLQEMQASERG